MGSKCHLAKGLVGVQAAIQSNISWVLPCDRGGHNDEAVSNEDERVLKMSGLYDLHDWSRGVR